MEEALGKLMVLSCLKQDCPEYYSKYNHVIMELDHLYNYLCQKFIDGQGVY